MVGILEKLQIYGYNKVQEEAILANMLVGEACLLLGPPGTAKTELVAAIGAALREDSKRLHPTDPTKWFTYQIYDASKMNFEDLVGLPDIKALQADVPEVKYIPSPSSIWNKHLIAFDELNRCQEDRQSNLFEIIRSRKLYGNVTNNKFIFSTINPFGDTGTVQMSDALVDRHLFYLRISNFSSMTPEQRRKVIARVGSTEARGINYWGNQKGTLDVIEGFDANGNVIINEVLADAGKYLRELLIAAATYYKKLQDSISGSLGEMINSIVERMAKEFSKESVEVKKETDISGRRASSIRRGILAVRAIQLAAHNGEGDLEGIMSTIMNVTRLCLPIGIGGKLNENVVERANKLVDATVTEIWPNIKQSKNSIDVDAISTALNTSNPLKILDTVLAFNMNEATRTTLISSLLDKNKYSVDGVFREDDFKRIQALIYCLNTEIPGFLPKHMSINLSPKDIAEVVTATEAQVDAIFADYIDVIAKKAASLKSNELLYLAYRTGFLYYNNLCKTDQAVIEALSSLNRLTKTIQDKVQAYKTNKVPINADNNDTKSGS